MAKAAKPIPALSEKDKKRFLLKVSQPESPEECHQWTAYRCECGYGIFGIGRKIFKAHRVAYFLHYGIDPGELCVMHSCDDPSCANPLHLSLGTHQDNMADMVVKGRTNGCKGEKNGRSKLTEVDIRAIRESYDSGVPKNILAKAYGIAYPVIDRIVKRELWKHI